MAALSLRKKKVCALAILVLVSDEEKVYEPKSRRFWVRKLFRKRKRYSLYHVLTSELRLFDRVFLSFSTNDTLTI